MNFVPSAALFDVRDWVVVGKLGAETFEVFDRG